MPGSNLSRLRRSSRRLGRIDCDLSDLMTTQTQTQTISEIAIICDSQRSQPLSVRCSSVWRSHSLGLKSRHDARRNILYSYVSSPAPAAYLAHSALKCAFIDNESWSSSSSDVVHCHSHSFLYFQVDGKFTTYYCCHSQRTLRLSNVTGTHCDIICIITERLSYSPWYRY